MKTLKIGMAGYDRMKARTMAIGRGEYKRSRGEPEVRFLSVQSFAKVLSRHNWELLTMVARENPGSLTERAELPGRNKSNLSCTLKTTSQYGFVELKEGLSGTLVLRIAYDQVSLAVSLTSAPYRVASLAANRRTVADGFRVGVWSTGKPAEFAGVPAVWTTVVTE